MSKRETKREPQKSATKPKRNSYNKLIMDAIKQTDVDQGKVSREAIIKHVCSVQNKDPKEIRKRVNSALKRAVTKGLLKQANGANGKFRIIKKTKTKKAKKATNRKANVHSENKETVSAKKKQIKSKAETSAKIAEGSKNTPKLRAKRANKGTKSAVTSNEE
jgi:hypothetical protein